MQWIAWFRTWIGSQDSLFTRPAPKAVLVPVSSQRITKTRARHIPYY